METTIVSSEWRIVQEFRHSGVIYSPGEPPPELSEVEAEALRQQGIIAKIGEDAVVLEVAPANVEDYLAAPDIVVLQWIRRWQPTEAVQRTILALAVRTMRSPMLVEALKLALGEPLESLVAPPVRDPVVQE